jgi:hypothetical protein
MIMATAAILALFGAGMALISAWIEYEDDE